MAEPEDEFQEFLRQLHLPDEVRDALLHNGYDCTLTFGLAFSSMQMLDQHRPKNSSPLIRRYGMQSPTSTPEALGPSKNVSTR